MTTERAQAVYHATKHLQFCDIAAIDIKDRLGLGTVAAGLRPLGVLEGDGVELERIRDVLVDHGFHTLVSRSVWSCREGRLDDSCPSLRLLREVQAVPTKRERVLWFCNNLADRKSLKGRALTKKDAGMLLGYPACCVNFQVESDAKCDVAFLNAVIAKVGHDEQSILRALKEDVGVDMPDDVFDFDNVARTDTQFPFVMHVACSPCLDGLTPLSADLNASHEGLAQTLDPALHELILEVRKLCANLRMTDDGKVNSRVKNQIDQLHRTAYPLIRRK
jgi:hypothetical protein